jgi:hypothetical protein
MTIVSDNSTIQMTIVTIVSDDNNTWRTRMTIVSDNITTQMTIVINITEHTVSL